MIAIGRITKSIGIKGELRVQPLTEHAERFNGVREVALGESNTGDKVFEIQSVRIARDHVVLKVSGIDSREEADAVKGRYVLIPDEKAVKNPEDTYFIHDLIGMTVTTDKGVEAGEIVDVVRLPGGDTWIIKQGSREILIPGVKEFIRNVDVKGRTVEIHTIEGLLE